MTIITGIIVPLLAGLASGAIYFGGLWLTLRRMPSSPRPGLLILTSYLGRTAAVLMGLFLIALGGRWERLVICLAGIVAVRFLLVRRWGERKRLPGKAQAAGKDANALGENWR